MLRLLRWMQSMRCIASAGGQLMAAIRRPGALLAVWSTAGCLRPEDVLCACKGQYPPADRGRRQQQAGSTAAAGLPAG